MKKIIFLILILIFLGKINLFTEGKKVCCAIICPPYTKYVWLDSCDIYSLGTLDMGNCSYIEVKESNCSQPDSSKVEQSTSSGVKSFNKDKVETKPGKVSIEWEEKQFRICPPGIFGTRACEYPDIQTIIQKFIDFILKISPVILVILLILGGFFYMFSVFKPDFIKVGHKYIQWAVSGYIILLLITLVFTFISAIFGGPKL